MDSENNFDIRTLGEAKIPSPIHLSTMTGDRLYKFIEEKDRILVDISLKDFNNCVENDEQPACMEIAGPRGQLFFDPMDTTAAIVTCG